VDIALASDADGVQVGASSLPVSVARRLLGDTRLVGCSVHSVEEARQAEADSADYLIVGTVFETASHPGKEPEGLGLVRQVRGAVRIPILGIGGITAANAAQVVQAGADGVAVISALLGVEDPSRAARELRATLEAALPLSRAGA
jgi:thiamine-phosphate pyrophosphorylase